MMFDTRTDKIMSGLLIVGTALVQGQISASVTSSITRAALPAWTPLFAGFSGFMVFALAIAFWLLITGATHTICLTMDGRGTFGRFLVGAGFGYLPYLATTLMTFAAVVEIAPEISSAVREGVPIDASLHSRLRPYGILNNAAQALLFAWVAVAAWRVHGVSPFVAVTSVAIPVAVVLLTRYLLRT